MISFARPTLLCLFTAASIFIHASQAFTSPRIERNSPRVVMRAATSGDEGVPKRVGIVGGGPAGLLLANLLLEKNENISVTLFESRADPRAVDTASGASQRAYALGVGMRGRTAIRAASGLWEAVVTRGCQSSRFQLHAGPFVIPLRDDKDGKGQGSLNEPSLLLFQSDLCAAMLDELEKKACSSKELEKQGKSGRLKVTFGESVNHCDLKSKKIVSESNSAESFDLIVGCDGVNSVVRQSIDEAFENFDAFVSRIPGIFKVVKMKTIPGEKIDPTSVSLIIPKSGATTAFVEPTDSNGSCCILFAGKEGVKEDKSDLNILLEETSNATAVREALSASFSHKFTDESYLDDITQQLMAQTHPGRASSVQCNTYHFGDSAVLVGDAAHATGGVSGQGVNSALVDSMVLAEELTAPSGASLNERLFRYSSRQVPEGKALYDLSFGPKPEGPSKMLQWAFINARDALFRGRLGIGQPPLQTRLTTSLEPFAQLRQERDKYYDIPFKTSEEFESELKVLDDQAAMATGKKPSDTKAVTK